MCWQAIPVKQDVPRNLSDELVQELQHLTAADRLPRMESEVQVASGRDHADGANLGPVIRVGQNRRLPDRCPGPLDERSGVKTAFIQEPYGDATRNQFFCVCAQWSASQVVTAWSSRSAARRLGFCGLKPMRWRRSLTE